MNKFNLIFSVIFLSICFSCSHNRILESASISNKEERIEILSKEVKMFSKIKNAEFHLFNVNGFSNSSVFLPGASSSEYFFVVQVNSDDINYWSNNLIEVENPKEFPEWASNLINSRQKEWKINSTPKFYKREESAVVEIIIFEKEGIIFKRIVQN